MNPGQSSITSAFLWWRLGDRKTRVLLAALFSFLALMAGLSVGAALSGRPYGDFFAMWTFARFALSHPAAQIYDLERLHAFQRLYTPSVGWMPFPYPPYFLLLLAPLGLAPIGVAWAIWTTGGLGAYLASIFAGRWRRGMAAFAALAPATVVSLITGQTGLFSSALMIGGARLMISRPIAAGILFGLMAFKPQLGLLIPVALIAARAWRCFWAATATVLSLAAAATAALGPSIWPAWIAAMRRHWEGYVTQGNATRLKMPTITANLELMGVGPQVAQIAQIAVLVAVAAVVWICFRRRVDRWAVAVLMVGGFLATPYAFFYDLPTLTFAIVLAVAEMARTNRPWHAAEVAVLLLAFLAPYEPFAAGMLPFPLGASALVLLFIVLARRALANGTLDAGSDAS